MSTDHVTYFGIDLGTTNSAISYVDETGRPVIVRSAATGMETTPSVVHFESADHVVVGEAAKNVSKLYPDEVVSRIKRDMGKEREWEFHGKTYTPESISALILKDLAQSAARQLQTEVRSVVITVPAYFGMLERDATVNAGRIAGLDVIGIVPEPVAAALEYEVKGTSGDRTILVYDLGGGTFDTTVIRVAGDAIEVLCTDGDQMLGGLDWDDRLVAYLVDELVKAGVSEDPRSDEEFMQELALKAESLKKELSASEVRPCPIRFAGTTAKLEITRATFESITSDLLDRTFDYTDRTLEKLGKKLGNANPARLIDEVLLVGGSTKMPAVSERMAAKYGWAPRLHDPDLAVAKGAARFALSRALWDWDDRGAAPTPQERQERIATTAKETGLPQSVVAAIGGKRITNVLPKSFGVKLVDTTRPGWQNDPEGASYIQHLVHADDELPSGPHNLEASTAFPNQTSIAIEVYEQAGSTESRELAANKPLDNGKGEITGLPPLPAGSPVNVVMSITADGLLNVHATDVTTNREVDIQLHISVLSEAQVEQARQDIAAITVRS